MAVAAYIARLVDPLLDELLAETSAVMLVGPRACGKTTLAARRAKTVVKLDAATEAAAFVADPDVALRGIAEPVLLDEWQAVPAVFGAARRAVDADPRPNRFYLAGSVRAESDNEVWPGTGRFMRVPMYPMTQRELIGDAYGRSFFDRLADGDDLVRALSNPPDLRGYIELASLSGFPRAALTSSDRARRMWLRSYLEDLLTHDAEELAASRTKPRDAGRLRAYFEAYALNSSGVPEHRTIFDAAGIARDTANAYERLLTRLLVIEQMPAWTPNRLKRLVHAPKRYVIDPALMMAALRLDVAGVLGDGDILGRVLDTFVMAQLRAEVAVSECEPRMHHLRTQGGRQEVDILAELGGGRVIAIEVKASSAPKPSDARHLRWLRGELGDRFLCGVVFHTGPRAFALEDRILAAPIAAIWG
jgi:predicted AAA+ superfamily ATPase